MQTSRVATLRDRLAALALLASLACAPGCAGLEGFDLSAILPPMGTLSEATVADGLREALSVGTERAVGTLSVPGGFAADPALRLRLPRELDQVAATLDTFGLGAQLRGIEDTMNRAAEGAAAEAVPVFAQAIAAMTLEDAFGILNGGEDAATRYFREHTTGPLRARFAPVVDRSMQSVGLYAKYRDLVGQYEALPFVKPQLPDIADYVTDRTLDGLFTVLAREEALIREDPAARTTALLRRVFGAAVAPGAVEPVPTGR